ncbi:MAG: DUF2252 family protein [Candidatus Poribacteria bacterium]|nr:DUF2252 family protein [Candidatus Poribacteria bacterium]
MNKPMLIFSPVRFNRHRKSLIICFLSALLCSWGCATTPTPVSDSAVAALDAPPMLYVSMHDYDFSQNPELLERLISNPYGYFRFINIVFSQAVCERYRDLLPLMSIVNLHGDAHLEQYAVSSLGHGLADFDDSSAGPAIIDIVRFGVSIVLTCRQRHWIGEEQGLLTTFLDGYRMALENPDIERPSPDFTKRTKRTFTSDRAAFLGRCDSLMEPLAPHAQTKFETGFRKYTALMLDEYPELSERFFEPKKFGRLKLGYGSALDRKFLIRIEGPSARPDDDIILEAKEVRNLRGIDCVHAAEGDAFRILIGQSRIANLHHRFLGHFPRSGGIFGGEAFWVQSWADNYTELNIMESLESLQDLREIVYDVGLQLGRGHTVEIADPLDFQLRRAQLTFLSEYEEQIKTTVEKMAAMTVAGWEVFREEATQRQSILDKHR